MGLKDSKMGIRFRIRSHTRFRLDCPVYFMGTNFLGRGSLVNLSKSGSRIEGDQTVFPGTTLALRLFLPDKEAPVRVEQATVRWSNGTEFGLQILNMPPEDDSRLGQFIKILSYKPFFWLS